MSKNDWSLISLLSSSIGQCQSIEFMPLTSTDDYIVYCHCEEQIYLCLNLFEIKSIVNQCYRMIFSDDFQEDRQLNILTRVLLCYVTECLTCWNIRRRLISSRTIQLEDELQFIDILLQLKPKSEQLFRYRRWILRQEKSIENLSLDKELQLCDRTAEKHFINYASWLHRRWLIDYFHVNIDEELHRNHLWLKKNISDSSGFSFRAYLLAKKPQLIEEEFHLNETMLKFYVDRESLWIYRQTLLFFVFKYFPERKEEFLSKERQFLEFIPENVFSNRHQKLLTRFFSIE